VGQSAGQLPGKRPSASDPGTPRKGGQKIRKMEKKNKEEKKKSKKFNDKNNNHRPRWSRSICPVTPAPVLVPHSSPGRSVPDPAPLAWSFPAGHKGREHGLGVPLPHHKSRGGRGKGRGKQMSILYCADYVLYCPPRHCAALPCAVLCCLVLFCTPLDCTALCCAAVYCTLSCCSVMGGTSASLPFPWLLSPSPSPPSRPSPSSPSPARSQP